jgi:hypothetical protein
MEIRDFNLRARSASKGVGHFVRSTVADEPPANDPPSPAEPGADFHLAPAPTDASDKLQSSKHAPNPGREEKGPSTGPPPQFSLSEFLLWIAIMSVGLSGLAWIAPPMFAGVCGFLALAAMIITLIWNPQAPMFQLVWYALLFMYLIALIIAFLAPRHAAH